MNWFERLVVSWLLNRIMNPGYLSKYKLIKLFKMIREKTEDTFYEDNVPTLDAFLQEAFDESKK